MAYSTISKPGLHHSTLLYTGDNSTNQAITGVGFQPDLVWMKIRSGSTHNHVLVDKVRGVNKLIFTNSTSGNSTNDQYGYLQSFDTDGFTTQKGSDGNAWNVNGSGTYASFNWKAGGTTGSSNSDGSITSSVSVNTTADFSIVSYTGTGSNATIGHGLGAAPGYILIKQLTGSNVDWFGYHKSISPSAGFKINLTGNASSDSTYWNNTASTNSVFSVGTTNTVNGSGVQYIAYCWAEVKGYSKFGTYTGNGNDDGPMIYTGFKPAWVLVKNRQQGGDDWLLHNNKSPGFNVNNKYFYANTNNSEINNATLQMDLLSNGFKIRKSTGAFNNNGETMIYMAFAEEPLVANVGQSIPATAR